jgi:hypothetical protein
MGEVVPLDIDGCAVAGALEIKQAQSDTMSSRNVWHLRLAAPLLAASVAGLLLLMPTSSEARVYVRIAPPVPIIETLPSPPGPGYYWIPGSWLWVGDHYVWHHGYYALSPFPGAVWVEGHWSHHPHGWYWTHGHWRR